MAKTTLYTAYRKGGSVGTDLLPAIFYLKSLDVEKISNMDLRLRVPDYINRYGSIAQSKLLSLEKTNIELLANLIKQHYVADETLNQVEISRQDYEDSLAAAEVMLETAETEKELQEFRDYIEALKVMLEVDQQMSLGGFVLGVAAGAAATAIVSGKKNPTSQTPNKSEFTITEFPDKIQFWDDIKGWKKEGMQDGPMPRKFRHHEKFVNGEWQEITKKEWDAIFTQGPYKRKQRSEKGKFVYYKVD